MSETISMSVDYDAPFKPTHLRAVFDAVRLAVRENWETHYDRLSASAPTPPIDVDQWLRESTPEQMHLVPAGTQTLFSRGLTFSFSPVSNWAARLVAIRWEDGTLGISVRICDRVRFESGPERAERLGADQIPIPDDAPDPDSPEYERWEHDYWLVPYRLELWPTNRLCLLHILDRIRNVLPVRRVYVDEQFGDVGGREK